MAIKGVVNMERKERDTEIFSLMKETLYTPVIGDIMDAMGYTHQFLPASIHPLQADMKLVGYAMTVLMIDVYGPQEKPFGYLTEALDQLKENEIYLATGGTKRCAYWGELLTATAKTRKATGAVIHGYHRDTPQILTQDFPVFSCGCYGQDSSVRTQVINYRCHIEIGEVSIDDGDILFGDVDGVVVIPQSICDEVIHKAFEKAKGEKVVRKAIENGMSATAAFAKFGIL
jgi:regulator of RNase E activity RraA